ncbi:SDR family oxidoreductase [Emticicia sp. CRIBPO]|uniref:SDR family NAD(P)-dependent oxidoreductase n=1 Tax=Emticicia sp. CRIBPO TaxID=2683258 RepID=UPI001412836E|nr:SDR family NAD(P)-dependent oxidoreductase [Emticicia sp. CRIBPO]NBA85585.1 SDR family oxidoreductase [Emticicia sp. CRIBPO]
MKRLEHKKALVTGASRGIGRAIALQLAGEGAMVGIHYLENKAEAEALQLEIESMKGKAFVFQADLGDTTQAIQLGHQAWETMGGIDILVNNAGVSYKKHFLDFTEEDVDTFLNINYKGALFLTQTISRYMVESQTEGSIYSVTSVNGLRPGVGQSAYGASKNALDTLMKGVALELAPHQIKVNTIAVGAIETDMTLAARQSPVFLKEVNEGIAMGRFGKAEEVASVIVDLVASGSYMTGATITLDGGLLLMRGYDKPKPYQS